MGATEEAIYRKIIHGNFRRESRNLSQYACFSNKGLRRDPNREKVPDRKNIRATFSHDSDRILHSKAYARYIDKTQVFYLFENDHITHRVLHVQLVAKIGRLVARALCLNEDLVEAISLGHDLGHVPYGHDGEVVLDEICRTNGIGSFCHNAQSVRFLMDLENDGAGLNLTLQVLDGILCHNGEIVSPEYRPNPTKNWVSFMAEYESCIRDGSYSKRIMPMTLEGCVMRISDVIAYIGRDIEDAIILKVMNRDELPAKATEVLGSTNAEIVNALVMDLIANSYGRDHLQFSSRVYDALAELKNFNYQRIYKFPPIRTEEHKIQKMFRDLFDVYLDDVRNGKADSKIQEVFLKSMRPEFKQQTNAARIVVDFIAGMTDSFFNNQHKELFSPKSYEYYLRVKEST
jgi:dGTPase